MTDCRRRQALLSHCVVAGTSAVVAAVISYKLIKGKTRRSLCDSLPKRIILLRPGKSEIHHDRSVYGMCPDNQIELTDEGSKQALAAGERIKKLIGEEKLDLYVSPFQRALQTTRNLILSFSEGQVRMVKIDPRIREQEFGNLQDDDFEVLREQRKKVGRFWYRFPTGESGGDVYDRTSAWWENALLNHNKNRDPVDNVLVVTHGLSRRMILMQLFGWSPDTLHTVWNGDHCSMYVLKYDASLPGRAPYRLDPSEGDMPASSKVIAVTFKDGQARYYVLNDYLSIPQPRTEQFAFVTGMLKEQHGIPPEEVSAIDFFAAQWKKFR